MHVKTYITEYAKLRYRIRMNCVKVRARETLKIILLRQMGTI